MTGTSPAPALTKPKGSLVSFNTISCNQEHNITFQREQQNKQYFTYVDRHPRAAEAFHDLDVMWI